MVNLKQENSLWKKGYKRVAGLDEAGRGPLAGPVVAAAVMLDHNFKIQKPLKSIKDSKKLNKNSREKFYKLLIKHPHIKWGIGIVSEKIIDEINIKNAAELAMAKAIVQINKKPDFLLIDGNHIKNKKLKTIDHKLIVKADEKVFSCVAASIVAKVTRDRIMEKIHKKYPQYGFDKHKGYPTKLHRQKLKKYGIQVIHRKSFCLFA